jgi:hypothetical protein
LNLLSAAAPTLSGFFVFHTNIPILEENTTMDKLSRRLGIVALFFGAIVLGWLISPLDLLNQESLDTMTAGKWASLGVFVAVIVAFVVLLIKDVKASKGIKESK